MAIIDSNDSPMLIDSCVLLGTQEAAQECGIDISKALQMCGIPQRTINQPEGFLPIKQVMRFLEMVAKDFDCQQFGFLVGKHQPSGKLGPLTQLLKLSPNVGTAIAKADKYSPLYTQSVTWTLELQDGQAALIRRQRVPRKESSVQARILGCVQSFKALKSICGPRWAPSAVFLSNAQQGNRVDYSRYFGAPVYFDSEYDAILFPEVYLKQPIPTADEDLLEIVEAHLSPLLSGYTLNENIVTKVRYHIRCCLGTRTCNLEAISQLLGVQPRSLQRMLSSEQQTFKSLLASVRHEVAVEYLRDSQITLIDLADMLGYQNTSAFSRAFKNRVGKAPDHWRKSYRNS